MVNKLAKTNAAARRNLIQQLTKIRENTGKTQEEIANEIGTTTEEIQNLETDYTNARLTLIANYAQAIGAELHLSATPSNK